MAQCFAVAQPESLPVRPMALFFLFQPAINGNCQQIGHGTGVNRVSAMSNLTLFLFFNLR
jgi:hypothetical protein